MGDQIRNLAIVIVTYKRQELLDGLLKSILLLDEAPWRVYVVDNENSEKTRAVIDAYAKIADEGLTAADWSVGVEAPSNRLVYVPMSSNTGGAGGFSEGVKLAYQAGAEWFWLMDDDVEVLPDAIERLAAWTEGFDVIQGARLDYDGGPFYWQYRFIEPLGMYNPIASSKPTGTGYHDTNAMCFEGALFSRKVVEELGPPDERFFIYWDDCVYGYRASKHFKGAAIDDVIMRRARDVSHWEVTGVRQLNGSSDMTRYHVMRNRGHMANYMKQEGDYSPALFGLGTAMVFSKELIRLLAVDRKDFVGGVKALMRGWHDSREIMHDPDWKPIDSKDLPK